MKAIVLPLIVCLFSVLLAHGETESRIALVMGVGNYDGRALHALPGIDKDLAEMSAALKQVGFEVTVVSDPTLAQAENAIDDFGTKLKAKQGVGLFYFSGHGGEFEGKNYLIPRGARLGDARDIKEQAVAAQRVLNRMEGSGARVNIVFLDCCRNDMTKAATDTGLAAMSARGTFIGFATASEKTSSASDEGSPYTKFLVKNLATPGLSILDMHTQVTAQVQDFTKEAGAEQVPFSYSGLRSPFYFLERSDQVAAGTTGDPMKASKEVPFINSLGMKFVPVPGTKVLFCIYDTRKMDYRKYAEANNGVDEDWKNSGFSQTEDHPVVKVSWDDADAFCKWLSNKEGATYRLPSDLEWSAAVGLSKELEATPSERSRKVQDVYPWGRNWPPPLKAGNYGRIQGRADDDYEYTSPVGRFDPNELGLFDMGGNVWQWCDDWYDPGRDRVLRGGSWIGGGRSDLLSSNRASGLYVSRVNSAGFRCVLVAARTTPEKMPPQPLVVPRPPLAATAAGGLALVIPATHSTEVGTTNDPSKATKESPFMNSLGMKFVPVPGTKVLFSIWDTRRRDYATFAAANSGVDDVWKKLSFTQTEEHPVVNVTWKDASLFCEWLTKVEGGAGRIGAKMEYRLPTDVEWSYAVGLGKEEGATPAERHLKVKGVYPWGLSWPPQQGRAGGNYGNIFGLVDDGYDYTSPVGSFEANAVGLYDMGGNVSQWCQDKFDSTHESRVMRGGSFDITGLQLLLSSYRYVIAPGAHGHDVGFRSVLAVTGTMPVTTTPQPIPPQSAGSSVLATPADLPASGFFDLDAIFSGTSYDAFNHYSKGIILQKAQQKLKNAGLYSGPIDGAMGRGSEQALLQWQRQQGLAVNGRVDKATIASLGLEGSQEGEPPQTKVQKPDLSQNAMPSKPSSAESNTEPVPTASATNKPGRVKLPFPPYTELDVKGLPIGSIARDPMTNKLFRVPPKPDARTLPKGSTAQKPLRVKSPYPPYTELDVTGLPSGSMALDPTTNKLFRVP